MELGVSDVSAGEKAAEAIESVRISDEVCTYVFACLHTHRRRVRSRDVIALAGREIKTFFLFCIVCGGLRARCWKLAVAAYTIVGRSCLLYAPAEAIENVRISDGVCIYVFVHKHTHMRRVRPAFV